MGKMGSVCAKQPPIYTVQFKRMESERESRLWWSVWSKAHEMLDKPSTCPPNAQAVCCAVRRAGLFSRKLDCMRFASAQTVSSFILYLRPSTHCVFFNFPLLSLLLLLFCRSLQFLSLSDTGIEIYIVFPAFIAPVWIVQQSALSEWKASSF